MRSRSLWYSVLIEQGASGLWRPRVPAAKAARGESICLSVCSIRPRIITDSCPLAGLCRLHEALGHHPGALKGVRVLFRGPLGVDALVPTEEDTYALERTRVMAEGLVEA